MLNKNEKNNEFSFSAKSNENKMCLIKIFIENNYLNLYCNYPVNNKNIEYICKATYEELKRVNIFSITHNLKQAFNSIKNIITNNIKMNIFPSIIKQTNEIMITIPNNLGNNNNLIFKLYEKEKNLKEIENYLII